MVNTIHGPKSYQAKVKDGVIKTGPESSNISPTLLAWQQFFPHNPNQLPSFYPQYSSEDHTQVKQEILPQPHLFQSSQEPTPHPDIFHPSQEPPTQSYFYQPSQEFPQYPSEDQVKQEILPLPHLFQPSPEPTPHPDIFQPSQEPLPQPDFFQPSQEPPSQPNLFQPNPQHDVFQPSHRERPLQPNLFQSSRQQQPSLSQLYQSSREVPYPYPPYPPHPYYYPYQPPGYFPDPYGYGSPVLADPMAIFYGDWQHPSEKIEPQEEDQLLAEIQNVKRVHIVNGEITNNVANLTKVKIENKPEHVDSVDNNEYKPTLKVEPVFHETSDSVGSTENVWPFSKPTSTNVPVIKNVDPVEAKYSGQSEIEPKSTERTCSVESKIDFSSYAVDVFEQILTEDLTNTDTNSKDVSQEEKKITLTGCESRPGNPESVYSEWIFDDPVLPIGWISRSYNAITDGILVKDYQFMSPDQTLFSSLSSLIDYMKSVGSFSRESIENLIVMKSSSGEAEQSLMKGLSNASAEASEQSLMKGLSNASAETSPRNLPGDKKGGKRKAINLDEWEDDDTLPEGWKKKANLSKSSSKVKILYLNPDQQKMFSSFTNLHNQDIIDKITFDEMKLSNAAVDSSQTDMKSEIENLNANEDDTEQNIERNNEVKVGSNTSEWENKNYVASNETIMDQTKIPEYSEEEYSMRNIEHIRNGEINVDFSTDQAKIPKYSKEDSMQNIEHISIGEINVNSSLDQTKILKYSEESLMKSLSNASAGASEQLLMKGLSNASAEASEQSLMKGLSNASAETSEQSLMKGLSNASAETSPRNLPGAKKGRKRKAINLDEWDDDDTLPEGWKMKANISKSSGKVLKILYLCPDQQNMFSSRKEIVTYMNNYNLYNQDIIDKVTFGGKCLTKISPKNDRPSKKRKLSNATMDSSQTDIKSDIENHLTVNEQDTEQNIERNNEVKLESYTSEWKNEKSMKNNEHVNNGEINLKSYTSESKTDELVAANESNAPPTNGLDVENLNPTLDLSKMSKNSNKTPPAWSDWEFDESLPKDWKIRSQQRTFLSKGESKIRTYHQYLSSNGQTFSSKAQLITHMKQSQIYSQEDIMAVNQNKKVNGKKIKSKDSPAKEVKIVENKKIDLSNDMARENERTPTKVNTKSSDDGDGWKTDSEILPEGWRKRVCTSSNDTPVVQYLSSNQKVFNSEKEVFSYMKSSSIYSLDDVLKFLSGVKRQENGEDKCQVSSEEDVQYDFECEYCPQQFPSSTEKSRHRQVEHTGQLRYKCNECGFGDLKKSSVLYHVQSKHSVNIPASQVTFHLQVPKKMITTHSEKTAPKCGEISSATKTIKKGARAKQTNQTKTKYVTKDNQVLTNPDKEGNDIRVTNDQYDKCNLKVNDVNEVNTKATSINLSDRLDLERNEAKLTIDCNEKVENANLHNWITDETLPEGWKRSLVGHDSQRNGDTNMVVTNYQYLSPEGRVFYSRKEALEHIDIYTHIEDQISTLAFEIEDEQHKERQNFDSHEDQTIDESDLETIESRLTLLKEKRDKSLVKAEQNCPFNEQDVNENSVQENLNIKTTLNELEYFSVPVGPLVTLAVTNFEMLSLKFMESPNPSLSEMEDICEGNSMDVKDIKWIFIKLRHKFNHKKRKEVDKEAVLQMVKLVEDKYQNKDYFII